MKHLAHLLLLGLVVGETATAASRPDVLLIMADDMSDWIQLLDRANPIATPNLDRLARRGVSFSRAYAASPACNPSRTALLTGRAPSSTGVYGNAADWRGAMPDVVTLPQAFMRAGYRVEGAGKVFHHHMAGAFHDTASFHDFLPMPWPPDAPMPRVKLNGLADFGTANTDWGPWPAVEAEALDVRSTDWCIARLRQPRSAPLFLACGLFRPHMPLFVPRRWLDRYPTNKIVMPSRLENDLDDVPPAGRKLCADEAGKFWLGMMKGEQERPGSWREAVRCYQAAATFADAQIGRLLDALDASPRGKSALIVFCSDNGYQLGEKDAWEKFTLWEKATRVPLVVVAPGVTPPGATCARPVSLLDLYPTLVELCGLMPNASLEGRSLVPLLRSPDAAWERPAVMTYLRGNHAVRSERWRYIRYANGDEELYDHAADPHEWTNLAARAESGPIKEEHARWLPRTDAPPVQDMIRKDQPQPPPNAPAAVEWDSGDGRLRLRYHGAVILDAAVRAEDVTGRVAEGVEVKLEPSETRGEKVEQRLRFVASVAPGPVTLVLRGTVRGSEEAFPAETDGEAQKRFPLVRNSVGLSRNLRNNAVYDRRWDWQLCGPDGGATRIEPKTADERETSFAWETRGRTIELVFRPRFYQRHRGLRYFEPWTYRVWKGTVTGYCTWWAYRHAFSQQTLDEIVDVFAGKKLPDFGYKYVQLDDAYQIGNGSCPTNWLTWNGKFPGGAGYALKKIQSAGMEGGIWVHRVHRPGDPHVAEIGKQHPDWFVQKADGTLFADPGFYVLNTRNEDAIDGMVRPTYRALKQQGWGYVKIDGAGDLLNAYKNKNCADHFQRIESTPEESLRDWDRVAREELGPGVYILNCWGVGPGLNVIGLADGCRLADDGFQPETLASHSSYEGVVWRNDPDHCDILGTWLTDEDAMMPVFGTDAPVPVRTIVRPAVCSMAGGVLMVSDKVETYRDDANLEGMKRSAPVLPTVPGQLYDPGHKAATWWLQEIHRPFESWAVLSHIQWAQKREKEWKFDLKGLPPQEIKFADLGLEEEREYLVFEFWTQKFLGKAKKAFTAPAMDENNGMQVFAIREALPHPWVISTTRHVSQGGVDLLDEQWAAGRKLLSGRSAVVSGDPYVMTVHVPEGFRLVGAEASGRSVEIASQNKTATVRIVPSATGVLEWTMNFGASLPSRVGGCSTMAPPTM